MSAAGMLDRLSSEWLEKARPALEREGWDLELLEPGKLPDSLRGTFVRLVESAVSVALLLPDGAARAHAIGRLKQAAVLVLDEAAFTHSHFPADLLDWLGAPRALEGVLVALAADGVHLSTRARVLAAELSEELAAQRHGPTPNEKRASSLAIAARAVLADLEVIRAALRSGDDDQIRRAIAGPIGIAAAATVDRLRPAGPSMPQDPVSTGELTGEEISAAQAANTLFVDANGYGFVPRAWLSALRGTP